MKIIREKDKDFPYSLNDAHIIKMKLKNKKIKVYFDQIHYCEDEQEKNVEACITFHDVDYELSGAYGVKYSNKLKKLKEKKYRFTTFLKKNENMNIQIITEKSDEYYTVWTGWVYKDKEEKKEDFMIKIWNSGKVVYHVEDET